MDTGALTRLMWDEPPASALGNLRTYAHHARATLAGSTASLQGSPLRGYRLEPGDAHIDLADFRTAVAGAAAAAANCDHRCELRLLGHAVGIWSGPLASGAHGGTAFEQMVDAISLARVDAEEALLAARLAAGRTSGLAGAVTEFLGRHPWRDRMWELLMRTYVACGDIPAALATFHTYRRARGEQLGLAPAPAIAELNAAIIPGRPAAAACGRCGAAGAATGRGEIWATGSPPDNLSTGRPSKEPSMPMPADEFTEFAAATTHRLLRSAYLLTGDLGTAEDLVQEALLQTYRHGHRISIAAALESYTRTTMFRLQVSVWRRRRFRTVGLDQLHPYAEPAHNPTDGVPTAVVLHNALARLPARQRAVVVLRFVEDASVTETAEILRCGTGTVKSQTAKALVRLRQLVPRLEVQPDGSTT